MRLISVDALKDGEVLHSTITNCKGIVMLKGGTTVTATYIERLKSVGIHAVYIDDDSQDEMEIRPALSDEAKLNLLDFMGDCQKNIKRGHRINFNDAKKLGREVYDEVKSASLKPINLVNTYAVDSPILLHSINVAVIVAALASRQEIRRELAENYIVGALFHDIALSGMDDDKDPKHAQLGYEILKDSSVMGPTAYMPIAMHHERFDGKGKPRGFAGEEINEGARMIAVADTYDNTLFGYSGFKRLSPFAAVEFLAAEAGRSLDPKFVDLFSKCVAIYPTGATVQLNNGQKAIVVSQNAGMPTRPVVRLIKDEYELMDLLWEHTVFINELYL